MLIWYATQYASIALPGVVGLLAPWSMIAVTMLVAGALFVASRARLTRIEPMPAAGRWSILACLCVVLALAGSNVIVYRTAPVIANDSLTYHLPAAVQWLQTGRLGLYETWYFNPANTYSPLAGSTFAAWLMGFTGNDVLARFVEAPPLVMIFFGVLQLGRALGASLLGAALIATAVACSRPFISQIVLAKDDLFVAAFFVAAVVALSRPRLRDALGPWRLGAALGLMLATKYTALLSLPVLLLAIDAGLRVGWRWREHAIASAVTVLLAGPWFVRNAILTGNPLFPADVSVAGTRIFSGMFTMLRSARVVGIGNVWHAFTGGYFSTSPILLVALLVAWTVAVARSVRRLGREPLVRVVLLGPIVGFGLFVFESPYGEIRFVNPSLSLLFTGIALIMLSRTVVVVAGLAVICALATSFTRDVLEMLAFPAAASLAGAAGVFGGVELWRWLRQSAEPAARRASVAGLAFVIASVLALTYIFWPSYVIQCRADFRNHIAVKYTSIAPAWQFARETLPPDATIAYANTYYTYPLMGFELDRRVVYAPVRAGVRHVIDLGRFRSPTTGEDIPKYIVPLTNSGADRSVWLENLRTAGARYVFVGKEDIADAGHPSEPPELRFAREMPERFRPVFENDAAAVYEIVGP